MRDDGPPGAGDRESGTTDTFRAGGAGGGRAGERDRARSRVRLDPEALSIAIGARRRALAEMADRRDETADSGPAQHRQRRTPNRTRRRAAAVTLAAVIAATGGGIAGFYWALAAVAPDPPGHARDTGAALSKADRETVERLLARLDFRVGAIDGRIDARTRAAIRRYRQYQGVPARNGRPTRRLLDNLRDVAALADPGDND